MIIAFTSDSENIDLPQKWEQADLKISPMPISSEAKLKYQVTKDSYVSIYITDMYGMNVLDITKNTFPAQGKHEQWINLSSLSSGMYICVLVTEDNFLTNTIILTK